jgi:hypothetical protein
MMLASAAALSLSASGLEGDLLCDDLRCEKQKNPLSI